MGRRSITAALAISAAVLTACGGQQKPSGPVPADAGADPGISAPVADAGITPAPAADSLSAGECDAFVDHVVGLAAASLASRATDPEAANTPDEITAIKAKLRDELRADCLRVDRPLFDCAMKATDEASLRSCQSGGEGAGPS